MGLSSAKLMSSCVVLVSLAMLFEVNINLWVGLETSLGGFLRGWIKSMRGGVRISYKTLNQLS